MVLLVVFPLTDVLQDDAFTLVTCVLNIPSRFATVAATSSADMHFAAVKETMTVDSTVMLVKITFPFPRRPKVPPLEQAVPVQTKTRKVKSQILRK